MIVFVYGTLKKGYGNNALLSRATFLGRATSIEKFDMIGVGFPVIFKNDEGLPVKGELYSFEDGVTLRDLDGLEGEGTMYLRKTMAVELEHDRSVVHGVSYYEGSPEYWKRSYTGRKHTDQYDTATGELEWHR